MIIIILILGTILLGLALYFPDKNGKSSNVGFEMFRIGLAALFLFLIFTKGA